MSEKIWEDLYESLKKRWWGILLIFLALLFVVSLSLWNSLPDATKEKILNFVQNQVNGNAKPNVSEISTSPRQMKTTPTVYNDFHSKIVIEGESFGACGKSNLFLMPQISGQGIASLNKKNGALFDQSGEMLINKVMMRGEPFNLSTDCFLTIIDTYEVQGHNSYKVFIGRHDN